MSSNQRLTLLSLCLVILIDIMGIGIVLPVITPLFMDVHSIMLPAATSILVRDILYGITLSIFAVTMFFGAPLLGDMSDKFGRKKVLLSCLTVTTIGYLLSAFSIMIHSVSLLIASRALNGLMAGSQPIAQAAIIDISTDENKTINLSSMTFAASLGFIVGPLMSGYFANGNIVHWFNYSTPFFVAAFFALLNAVSLIFTLKETFQAKAAAKISLSRGITSLIQGFANLRIRRFSVMFLLFQTGWSLYFLSLSLYAEDFYHFNATRLGYMMGYLGVCFAISFTFIIRIVLRYLNEKQIVTWAMAISAIGMPLITLFHQEWLFWLSIFPLTAANAVSYTSSLTLYSNLADRDSQGQIMGISSSIVALAWALGGILVGAFNYVSIDLPLLVAAFLSLGAWWLIYRKI